MSTEEKEIRRIEVRQSLEKCNFRLTNARKKSDEFKSQDGQTIYFFWGQGSKADIAIDPNIEFGYLSKLPGVVTKKTEMPNGLRFGTSMADFPRTYLNFKPEDNASRVGRIFEIDKDSIARFIGELKNSVEGRTTPSKSNQVSKEETLANEYEDKSSEEIKLGDQGYDPDPEIRKVVEQHAVSRAFAYYKNEGYRVTELGKPYDLHCEKNGDVIHVEVKGSRVALTGVQLTVNEVRDAEDSSWESHLFVVDQIRVSKSVEGWTSDGGNARLINNWTPDRAKLTPIKFKYELPQESEWLKLD